MTMTGHILRDDSLRTDGQSDLLEVGAPFFRGMPLSGVSAIHVTVGSEQDDDPLIKIGEHWHPVSSLGSNNFGEWFLQDRYLLKLKTKSEANKSHSVTVRMMISPPQFRSPSGDPVVLPVMRQAELKLSKQ